MARIRVEEQETDGHPMTGVATAFASPIGGLLFTIEEGASFYSTSIFWRGFLSTGIGVLTLHFLVECAVRAPQGGGSNQGPQIR